MVVCGLYGIHLYHIPELESARDGFTIKWFWTYEPWGDDLSRCQVSLCNAGSPNPTLHDHYPGFMTTVEFGLDDLGRFSWSQLQKPSSMMMIGVKPSIAMLTGVKPSTRRLRRVAEEGVVPQGPQHLIYFSYIQHGFGGQRGYGESVMHADKESLPWRAGPYEMGGPGRTVREALDCGWLPGNRRRGSIHTPSIPRGFTRVAIYQNSESAIRREVGDDGTRGGGHLEVPGRVGESGRLKSVGRCPGKITVRPVWKVLCSYQGGENTPILRIIPALPYG